MKLKIQALKDKAKRTGRGQPYLDDVQALADRWDEAAGTYELSDEAFAELRATWNLKDPPKRGPARPCNHCRGL